MVDKELLRALVILRIIVSFYRDTGESPRQEDVLSAVDTEWERLGIDVLLPFAPHHPPQFYNALAILRERGWLQGRANQRGKAGARVAYVPSEAGTRLAESLNDDWQQWRVNGNG
jgi:DNA-binding PadR family transcriptional regulator